MNMAKYFYRKYRKARSEVKTQKAMIAELDASALRQAAIISRYCRDIERLEEEIATIRQVTGLAALDAEDGDE